MTASTCFLKSKIASPTKACSSPSCSWDQQSTTTANSSTEEFDLSPSSSLATKQTTNAKKPCSLSSLVPRSVRLNQSLRDHAQQLGKIPLVPLNCTFGVVNPKPAVTLAAALKHERRQRTAPAMAKKTSSRSFDISIVFAVRHPGCIQCREHGQQLSQLMSERGGVMEGVHAWGIVKEAAASACESSSNACAKSKNSKNNNAALLAFYDDFFHFPLYMDEKWNVYKAMGDRKLSLATVIKQAFKARSRWARKGLCNQVTGGGDTWLQGGVLIFQRGKLRYAYEETFGTELDVDAIRGAIQALKEDDETTSSTLTENTSSSTSASGHSFVSTRTEI